MRSVPGLWHGPRDAPWQQWRSWLSQETPTPPLVLPQILRLCDEHQRVLRREHWQGILRHLDAIGTGLRQIIEIWSNCNKDRPRVSAACFFSMKKIVIVTFYVILPLSLIEKRCTKILSSK